MKEEQIELDIDIDDGDVFKADVVNYNTSQSQRKVGKGKMILLTYEGIMLLEQILDDLLTYGQSSRCPTWSMFTPYKGQAMTVASCQICRKLFPKTIPNYDCPCYVYSAQYLIRRVKDIISYNWNEMNRDLAKDNED